MKREKYDITDVVKTVFGASVKEGAQFHYHAYRHMDGGQYFDENGKICGRITWSKAGKSVTITQI